MTNHRELNLKQLCYLESGIYGTLGAYWLWAMKGGFSGPFFKLKADRPRPRDYSTHRQTPWTDNYSSLLFAAVGKAEPLLSGTDGQKDGHYQVHYLPRFVVDNQCNRVSKLSQQQVAGHNLSLTCIQGLST